MRLLTSILLYSTSTLVFAQSDTDYFLSPPALPLNVVYNSDSTPVTLAFAIGSTQTLRWETKLSAYEIIGRGVISDGEDDLSIYGM